MKHAIFLVNLLQDVNILRPLIYIAARDFGFNTEIFITDKFIGRDTSRMWAEELAEISTYTLSLCHLITNEFEAYKLLEKKSGLLIAASESNLNAHDSVHNIFKIAPINFIKITLQHGFECVGFLQSRQHDIAHGKNVKFEADIVCSWQNEEKLTSMHVTQKPKLLVTGPTMLLQNDVDAKQSVKFGGLICENLHSVRLNASGDLKISFMEMFSKFCDFHNKNKNQITLRPHPGGQYVIKNNITLPNNVDINNQPIYKINLSQFAYGVSAPSSVLIDMVLAGIPVAVWKDKNDIMDFDNYQGLTVVSSLEDWIEFSLDATKNPNKYLKKQNLFIEQTGMPVNAKTVYHNFKKLFSIAPVFHHVNDKPNYKNEKEAVVYFANALIPTLQLSFLKPLKELEEKEELRSLLITEQELKNEFQHEINSAKAFQYVERLLVDFSPTIIVMCRYSGPHAINIRKWAKQRNIPLIYHIDDDLLSIPPEIGKNKFFFHNKAERLNTVRYLLDNSTLVYASTKKLSQRFIELGVKNHITFGDIYCSCNVMKKAQNKQINKVGYMGFDHAHDLELVLPALIKYLDKFPKVQFELFGSIPKPKKLERFNNRIVLIPPVRDYKDFLKAFAERDWDIGICPLASTQFNQVKANTKWVEYTALGIAVIASKDTVYNDVCDSNCGLLASNTEEWFMELNKLSQSPDFRYEVVCNAQQRLQDNYSIDALKKQVLSVFDKAKVLALDKPI